MSKIQKYDENTLIWPKDVKKYIIMTKKTYVYCGYVLDNHITTSHYAEF